MNRETYTELSGADTQRRHETPSASNGARSAASAGPHPLISQYWLAAHVYTCVRDDAAVILNTKLDRYFAIEPEHARALAAVVTGWPASNTAPMPLHEALPVAEQFENHGFITRCASEGRSAAPPRLTDRSSLIELGSELDGSSLRTRDVVRFLDAYRQVSWALRYRSFEAVVRDVVDARMRAVSEESSLNLSHAIELLSVFRRMRGYIFAVRNRCLLHALLLTKFLMRYDQRPTWVIGVRTAPFAAHSWVQHAHFVLDTTPEKVCPYTPILAIQCGQRRRHV